MLEKGIFLPGSPRKAEDEKQKAEATSFLAGWLDKLSVGCLLVGMFQPEHIVGGIIGSIVCFALALIIKIRGAK